MPAFPKRSYQKELDALLSELSAAHRVPSLLLHSCCAPCSSYVLEYLSPYFNITVFYYNPNLDTAEEFERRVKEQERFVSEFPAARPVSFEGVPYAPKEFYDAVKGFEDTGEGGERCAKCFRLRLEKTAERAASGGFDYFTTTLSISPMKDPILLNSIGEDLAGEYGVPYLCSEFRKKNGFLRSTEISKEYGMYRQDYCGCVFSKMEKG